MLFGLLNSIKILMESRRARNTYNITPYEADIIEYLYSDRFLLANDQFPKLYQQFHKLCTKACLKRTPKFIVVDHGSINATHIRTGSIVITTGALKKLKAEELDFLLAHEITHSLQRKGRIWKLFGFPLLESVTGIMIAITTSRMNIINIRKPFGLVTVLGLYEASSRVISKLLDNPRKKLEQSLESDADYGALIITNNLEAAISQVEANELNNKSLADKIEKKALFPIYHLNNTTFDPHKIAKERIEDLKRFKAEIDLGKTKGSKISKF